MKSDLVFKGLEMKLDVRARLLPEISFAFLTVRTIMQTIKYSTVGLAVYRCLKKLRSSFLFKTMDYMYAIIYLLKICFLAEWLEKKLLDLVSN